MTNEQKQAIIEQLETVSDSDLHDAYNEVVRLAGCEYEPATTLKNTDPIAYRCGFNDWLDAECQDGIYVEVNDEYYVASEVEELLEAIEA